jgi:hypothetical protein
MTMEENFTPGPWHSRSFADDLSVYVDDADGCWLRVAYVDNGYQFFRDDYTLKGEERRAKSESIRRANSNLIAAAPDLYAALKEACEEIEGLRFALNNRGGGMIEEEKFELGLAALAKARGGEAPIPLSFTGN